MEVQEPKIEPGQHQASSPPSTGTAEPTTVVVTTTRKKKRRYSRGLKEMQQLGRGVSKASARVAKAVAKGMSTYRKRSDKSSLKKRDGELRDLGLNLAAGLGKTIRAISPLPHDLAKALNTKPARRRARRQLRVASRILRPLT